MNVNMVICQYWARSESELSRFGGKFRSFLCPQRLPHLCPLLRSVPNWDKFKACDIKVSGGSSTTIYCSCVVLRSAPQYLDDPKFSAGGTGYPKSQTLSRDCGPKLSCMMPTATSTRNPGSGHFSGSGKRDWKAHGDTFPVGNEAVRLRPTFAGAQAQPPGPIYRWKDGRYRVEP